MSKVYKVWVSWEVGAIVLVRADSYEEAEEIVLDNAENGHYEDDVSYLEGSINVEVDEEPED